MDNIKVFKASKSDKKGTIKVNELRRIFKFPKLKPGDLIKLKLDGEILIFKACRFDEELGDCKTVYGTTTWPSTLPKIGVGKENYAYPSVKAV
jgi:hypothetical protein